MVAAAAESAGFKMTPWKQETDSECRLVCQLKKNGRRTENGVKPFRAFLGPTQESVCRKLEPGANRLFEIIVMTQRDPCPLLMLWIIIILDNWKLELGMIETIIL